MRIIKLFKFSSLFFLVIGIVWFYFMSYEERWLVMNKRVAESYAKALLKGDVNYKTPDTFIDYTVVAENGHVLFSNHLQPNRIFGYFPKSKPDANNDNVSNPVWKKVEDNWYQTKY